MTLVDRLKKLIVEWRQEANNLDPDEDFGQIETYQGCADELEEILGEMGLLKKKDPISLDIETPVAEEPAIAGWAPNVERTITTGNTPTTTPETNPFWAAALGQTANEVWRVTGNPAGVAGPGEIFFTNGNTIRQLNWHFELPNENEG